jgi:hypothetical protein
MHRLAAILSLALLLPMARAGEKPDAETSAKTIAPFLDDQTIAVAHVDLSRLDVDAFLARLAEVAKVDRQQIEKGSAPVINWITTFKKAGGKDLFMVFSLTDLPQSSPFLVVPLGATSDEKALQELLTRKKEVHSYTPFEAETAATIHGALLSGGKSTVERLRQLKPSPRPDAIKAFAAAGETTAQVVVLPSEALRRSIAENLPNLPKELGGGPITVLTRGVQWAALGADATPKMALKGVVQCQDADAAKSLEELVNTVWRLAMVQAAKDPGFRKEFPDFANLVKLMTPKAVGDQLTLAVDEKVMVSVVMPAVMRIRSAAERARGMNNLKQIGLALHSYHDVKGAFPTAASYKGNKPLLSWRVQILPYLEQEALYKEFHLDEPWDSEHNKKLIAKMPKVYESSPMLGTEGKTSYLGVAGKAAMFPPGKKPVAIKDVLDGTSNTAFVVDASDERAVIWTKPDDYSYDPAKPMAGLVGRFEGGFICLLVDGSVRFVSHSISAQTLNAFYTRDGGEVLGPDF